MYKCYFNNVYVYMGNKKISIAQHWDLAGEKVNTQEIGIIHENGDIDIKLYSNTLDSLIEGLLEVKKLVNHIE